MKTLLILLTCFGLTAVAWAEMHEGKHHSGKMMFEKMDTNKDGTISVEEHEAGLTKCKNDVESTLVKWTLMGMV